MIQIQETDALWRFYKRYHKNNYNINPPYIPPPRNLCNYFWSAAGGALMWIFTDISTLITGPIFAVLTAILVALAYWSGVFSSGPHTWIAVPAAVFFIFSTLITSTCATVLPLVDWQKHCTDNDKDWAFNLTLGIIITTIFAVLFSTFFSVGDTPWRWRYVIYGYLIELGFVVACVILTCIWYVFFSGNTNLGKNTVQYLKAVKSRVCPLVEPPPSYYEEKREASLVSDS